MTQRFVLAAAALLLSSVATIAQAKVLASAVRPGNFSFTTATVAVPLDGAGATTLTVNARKATNYVLTYSAECTAIGGTTQSWLDIDVVVNGVAIAPTAGSSDAFCASTGQATFANWNRNSVTLVVPLIDGANTISITGRINAGATGGWLSDSSLVIHD